MKIKESKKNDKYLDTARELKKLLTIKVKVISIVVGALKTVHKSLEKGQEELEISGSIETFQTIELLRSARILRGVLET